MRKRIEQQQATPEQRRAIDRIAVVATAGLLASHWEIVKLSPEDIMAACAFVRDLWIHDEMSMSDAVHGAQAVREFVLKNRARFADLIENQQTTLLQLRVLNQAGYSDSKNKLFLFTGEAFQEACGGFDPKTVARELDRRGLLLRGEADRLTKKFAIPGLGERVRLYAVRAEVAELDVTPSV